MGFSKAGIKGRGDTSDWTLTPAQRAAQLEGGGPPAGPMLITAGPSEAAQQQRLERTAAAIDTYNAQRRKKSLLEKHMEKVGAVWSSLIADCRRQAWCLRVHTAHNNQ